jgi:tetratricopeptide (TPR) repeat protein
VYNFFCPDLSQININNNKELPMSDRVPSSLKPFLSVCLIVKNESQHLSRCLASVKPYADEIIVVDTGSQDNTPDIAREYGAKLSYFAWCDDFSAARNYSISQACGEWIFIIDADEELIVNNPNFLGEIQKDEEAIAYVIIRNEVVNKAMTPVNMIRLFRHLPEMRYCGRFHEQLTYKKGNFSNYRQLDSIKLLHHGNDPIEIEKKTIERNIPILERARQEEGLNFMLLYCLAGMYGGSGEIEKAQDCWEEALERLFPHLMEGKPPEEFTFIPSLMFTLAGQALESQDYETARLLCQRGLEWCPNYPPLNYITGMTLMALGFPLGAIAYFQNCLQLGQDRSYYTGEPFEQSFTTTIPACGLGVAYMTMKCWPDAISAFELALKFDETCPEAQQKLEKITQILANQLSE